MLEKNTQAPAFTLVNQDNRLVSLSDFLGQKSCHILLSEGFYTLVVLTRLVLIAIVKKISTQRRQSFWVLAKTK